MDFSQIGKLAEKYLSLGGSLKGITEKCLEFIPAEINPDLKKDMSKHKRSGRTLKSLVETPKVVWNNPTSAKIPVGFNLKKGGLPSLFLMYGTPRHKPFNQYGSPKRAGAKDNPGIAKDESLYKHIKGEEIKKQIAKKQEEILLKAIEEEMKGK